MQHLGMPFGQKLYSCVLSLIVNIDFVDSSVTFWSFTLCLLEHKSKIACTDKRWCPGQGMSRQLPLQLLLLLLLCLLLLLHTHTYLFSQPTAGSLFLEGDFLPEDKGIVLGDSGEEVVEDNYLPEDKDNLFGGTEETCLSSCLGQLQPKNGKAGGRGHQCGGRSADRGDNQR